jgi:hypothetical protein
MEKSEKVCCPPFDPSPWSDVEHEWENKRFIRDRVCCLFFMPLNFGSVMKRLDKKIKSAQAGSPEWLCLSDHISKWKMDVYLAVDREIPGANNITLSGRYISKVYEGSYKNTGNWMKDFEEFVKVKGLNLGKIYMWYTTCPGCAKKYGKNYTVIFGKVS